MEALTHTAERNTRDNTTCQTGSSESHPSRTKGSSERLQQQIFFDVFSSEEEKEVVMTGQFGIPTRLLGA